MTESRFVFFIRDLVAPSTGCRYVVSLGVEIYKAFGNQ